MKLKITGSASPPHELKRSSITLGREEGCDIFLPQEEVSGRHARFFHRDGRLCVEDLGSTNGTRVNGRPLRGAMELRPGDRLEFAGVKARVEDDSPAAARAGGRGKVPFSSPWLWAVGGALAAVGLALVVKLALEFDRPRRIAGGGAPIIAADSRPQQESRGSDSRTAPPGTGARTGEAKERVQPRGQTRTKTRSQTDRRQGARAEARTKAGTGTGLETRLDARVTVRVPERVRARRDANPRPWRSIDIPADPLPLKPPRQMPQWMEDFGLRPEWFTGLEVSLAKGQFRAALSDEAIDELAFHLGDLLQASSSLPAARLPVQAASFVLPENAPLPVRKTSYRQGDARRYPYLEIIGKLAPGAIPRIYGFAVIRPPDAPEARNDYEWVSRCEPIAFDLFIGQEALAWAEVQMPQVAINGPEDSEQVKFSEVSLRLSDLPFSFPYHGADFRVSLGGLYFRESEYAFQLDEIDIAAKTSGSTPLEGWAFSADIGGITGKDDGRPVLRFQGGTLRAAPRTTAGGKLEMATAVRLGELSVKEIPGGDFSWSRLHLDCRAAAPRAQWQALYEKSRRIESFGQLRDMQYGRAESEMFGQILDLAESGLVADYRLDCRLDSGPLLLAASIDWPGTLSRYKDPEKVMEEVFRTARLRVCAQGPESTVRQWAAIKDAEFFLDQAIAGGQVEQKGSGRLHLGFTKDENGMRYGGQEALCKPAGGRPAKEAAASGSARKPSKDKLFPIYGLDGETYYASVESSIGASACAGSAPFLNIIEDTRSQSEPEEIDPGIWIDGLTLYGEDRKTEIPWEEARPAIVKSLCFMPSLFESYPPSDFEIHDVGGGQFYLPGTFRRFVTDGWVARQDKRRAMYAKVFLDVFTAEAFYRQAVDRGVDLNRAFAGSFVGTWTAAGDVLGKLESTAQGAETAVWLANLQKARFDALTGGSAGRRISQSEFRKTIRKIDSRAGKKLKGLEWIALGLGAARSFEAAASRAAVMTRAAQLSVHQAQAEAVVRLLRETDHCDPAILEGAKDALVLMKHLEEERFDAFLEGVKSAGGYVGGHAAKQLLNKGITAAVKKVPFLHVSKVPVGAVGGAVTGLVTVGADTWQTSQRACYLGCLATAGTAIASGMGRLIEGDAVGALSPAEANLSALMRFNHQAAYLSYRKLNEELYHDRSLSKLIPYQVKDFFNPGLKESLLSAEEQMLGILLMETVVDAALPGLIAEIRGKYMPGSR